MNRRAVLYALASAILFGVTTPAAKVLLGTIEPGVLAGLFYCGAGVGTGLLRRVRLRNFFSDEIDFSGGIFPGLLAQFSQEA
jgi:hypothetical protein